jgi:hypothetical protein
MRRIATITALLALGVFPASSLAYPGPPPPRPSMPPMSQGTMYMLSGTLSHYVPATATQDGSVTIRVTFSNGPAMFARFSTLTFRVTPATLVSPVYGGIQDGRTGTVRVASTSPLTTLQALQALPAAAVSVDWRQPLLF